MGGGVGWGVAFPFLFFHSFSLFSLVLVVVSWTERF